MSQKVDNRNEEVKPENRLGRRAKLLGMAMTVATLDGVLSARMAEAQPVTFTTLA
jgi:hypothetical protein